MSEFTLSIESLRRFLEQENTRAICNLWHRRDVGEWLKLGPQLYELIGKKFIVSGEPLLAFDVTCESPESPAILHIRALALARTGGTAKAREILLSLLEQGHRDEECLGLLGRTCKDLAFLSGREEQRIKLLGEAGSWYHQAYRQALSRDNKPGAYYNGVNAATMALLSGDGGESVRIATEVVHVCELASGTVPAGEEYWRLVTLAECYLLLDRFDEAASVYTQAVSQTQFKRHWGSQVTTRRHVRLILAAKARSTHSLDTIFPIPEVICTAPHGRQGTESASDVVAFGCGFPGDELRQLIELSRAGGTVYLILPCPPEMMIQLWDYSAEQAAAFLGLCNQLAEQERPPMILTPGKPADPKAHAQYSTSVAQGMANRKAREWEQQYLIRGDEDAGAMPAVSQTDPQQAQQIRALLLADARGFSKLEDHQFPKFQSLFMGKIAEAMDRFRVDFPGEILSIETAGDGMCIVLKSIGATCHLAESLRSVVANEDWTKWGFPATLALRIALHAGPLTEIRNPLTGAVAFSGFHLCRGARIEPITHPGEIFASEPLMALASVEGLENLSFEYAGWFTLAKNDGRFPLHRLSARRWNLRMT